MEFGFYLPTHGPLATRQNLLKISEHAEKLEFDSMVAGDHVIAPIKSFHTLSLVKEMA